METRLKIVADKAVPFLQGVLEPWADMIYKDGEQITREDVMDADALIIRTRTKCDRDLLEGTKVKLVSTATIGTDHIDIAWCESNGILVRNAAGCNAGGVLEYVLSALYGIAARKSISLEGKTLGIIGVGHVGSLVESAAYGLGFRVLRNDPPKQAAEGGEFCTLDYLLANSNIVTMHVPLTPETRLMANEEFFSKMQPGTIFINTCRGEVVDEQALKTHIGRLGPVIIDTWQNEPDIDRELLDMVDIATPHIAGYSYQGKQNGTAAAVRAVAHYFGILPLYEFYPKSEAPEALAVKLNIKGLNQGEVASLLQYNYPVFTDDFMLRIDPSNFEKMRKEYKYRREVYFE